MSVLLFGVSHHRAPVSVLEQLSVGDADQIKIVDRILQSPLVSEAMVLSTCNRVEVYAVVEAFHGGLSVVGQVLADHSSMSISDITDYAYVRYSEAAVAHLFTVAGGLDSAVIGEQQVLGQIRRAYSVAEAHQTVGTVLHGLAQRALSVGKRVHTETSIDAAGASVVSVALDIAGRRLTSAAELATSHCGAGSASAPVDLTGPAHLAGRTAVVVGAGAMGRLSVAHLVRAGVAHIYVVNRSLAPAQKLVNTITAQGVPAQALTLDDISTALAGADVVISCTGAVRPVLSLADVHHALVNTTRADDAPPLVLCDLGMPRDIDPAVAGLPAVVVIDMDQVQREPSARAAAADTDAARNIVAAEVAEYLAGQRMAEVTPTVAALRQHAADVVAAELLRLENRLPELDVSHRQEIARTVHRVVDKLLHTPTVRVKQLANAPGGDSYAAALRELFALNPDTVDTVAAGELLLAATEFNVTLPGRQ